MKQLGVIHTALTSPPDREHLVVELLVGEERWDQIAEVRWEQGEFLVELYGGASGRYLSVPVPDLSAALEFAVGLLKDRYGQME